MTLGLVMFVIGIVGFCGFMIAAIMLSFETSYYVAAMCSVVVAGAGGIIMIFSIASSPGATIDEHYFSEPHDSVIVDDYIGRPTGSLFHPNSNLEVLEGYWPPEKTQENCKMTIHRGRYLFNSDNKSVRYWSDIKADTVLRFREGDAVYSVGECGLWVKNSATDTEEAALEGKETPRDRSTHSDKEEHKHQNDSVPVNATCEDKAKFVITLFEDDYDLDNVFRTDADNLLKDVSDRQTIIDVLADTNGRDHPYHIGEEIAERIVEVYPPPAILSSEEEVALNVWVELSLLRCGKDDLKAWAEYLNHPVFAEHEGEIGFMWHDSALYEFAA